MKILIIRFSSIGDIVLTTPIVRCIRQQLPGAEIHYLTKHAFQPVIAHNPHIDKVHYIEKDVAEVMDALKAEKFDYVADLHHNLRTSRVKQAVHAPRTHSFPKLNIRKWLLVNFRINMMPDKSIVERYFEAVAPLGVRNDGGGLDYYIPETARISNDDIPTSHWTGYVGCVIGGSYNTKKFPVAKWQAFVSAVPFPVILLGGPDDREEGNLIAAVDPVKIYNSCGKFNLNESAHLVERARVIVSNDTGLMHIATAFRKPVISLWGNTSPEIGMFPYYGGNNLKDRVTPLSFIMDNSRLHCHPCSKLGYDKCPKRHFRCMNDLDIHIIVEKVKNYWK